MESKNKQTNKNQYYFLFLKELFFPDPLTEAYFSFNTKIWRQLCWENISLITYILDHFTI